ncbi:MAG: adenosyl-hopene transferase HpnH [bacterium]|nr:hopanoid biosynthesis associated radical SAM protein HpnH [Deltaproteobacteria bacterium]MCP4241847.1 adenosyl-hopene transferase HpnH [bacterium]
MPVPFSQMVRVARHVLGHQLAGHKRFPLVLMLEPLYRCNLACAGCGKIQYPSNVLRTQLSVEECMRAVDEVDTPMVSIPGGEPLMHPQIDEIVRSLVARKKYVYLCTNALLLEEKLDLFTPTKFLSFSVHLDGFEAEHDRSVCRDGTYRIAVRAIEKALERGFRITTNTTLFDAADPEQTADFFDEAMRLGIEGMMVSPGYAYEKAPDQEHFLGRERTHGFFRKVLRDPKRRKNWRFNQSPLFIEFLAGTREYECTPWGMPTYSVFGWQRPCYLLQEGYAPSFRELLDETPWEKYGHASGNSACRDCMVHSGFEASSVRHAFSSWGGLFAMARAFFFGPRVPEPGPDAPAHQASRVSGPDAFPQGWSSPATPEALRVVFDYRGDVTLTLDDGTAVEGYVTNLRGDAVELWRRGTTETLSLPSARIQSVVLSGRDAASGRSYQTWLTGHERQSRAAAPPRA